ncbi:TIGR03619 family F420-dependent LLM class oxidoreductase [Gordonia sp. NPDC058843]|uniref:TIGR03619 family F420-dependent LLM class oxidoreductase n=1 Tax=Gordonia sp. NPDC058843 TaxID=3346648 RepID=UPI003686CC22
MRIGLSAYGLAATDIIALARDAEAAGFDSLWIGEHILAPRAYQSSHPQAAAAVRHHSTPHAHADVRLVDPLSTLAAAGAMTHRITLATGVYVAPLRHPLQVARSACTVAEISGNRLVLGLGAGWLAEEFDALNEPFAARFRRLRDSAGIIREALRGGWISRRTGEYVFDPVQITASTTPVPLVLGGNTDRALRRSVALGDGWLSSGTPTLEEAVLLRTRLDAAIAEHERSAPFRTWFRMPGADAEELHRWRDAGFGDIVIWANTAWPADHPRRGEILAEHALRLGIR